MVALFVLWLYVFCPPTTDQGPGVPIQAGPYAPPTRKMPPILPVSSVDATRIAINEVKKREGWVSSEPRSVQREGDSWFILIDNPAVDYDYRTVTVDGQDGRILEYYQPKRSQTRDDRQAGRDAGLK